MYLSGPTTADPARVYDCHATAKSETAPSLYNYLGIVSAGGGKHFWQLYVKDLGRVRLDQFLLPTRSVRETKAEYLVRKTLPSPL